MTYHIPMCPVCNENEVGSFYGSEHFCSEVCENIAQEEGEEFTSEYDRDEYGIEEDRDWAEDREQYGYTNDLSDDGDALASAGFGTDEDYGYFGGDEW